MKFSVITVVKNSISNIGLTIKSVQNQSFKNYEHIIFDGRSTDGTTEYIKKHLNKNIIYFRKNDKGLYDALNKSLKKAKGQYFVILHSGDFFYSKNSLRDLSKFLKKNENYDFCFSNILFYNRNKKKLSRVWKIPYYKYHKLNFIKIAHTSLCIKNKISKKFIYDKNFKISADTDYLLKLNKNFKGKYFDNFLLYMEDDGLSNKNKNFLIKLKEDFSIFYREFNLFAIILVIYKIAIKIPGFFRNLKKYERKFHLELKKIHH